MRSKLALAAAAIFVFLACAEAVLRLFYTEMPLYSPHPYLNYVGTPHYLSRDGRNRHNSWGYRGPEPAADPGFRLVLTGGSTTYDTGIKDWRNDTARNLERVLRERTACSAIEVVNAGVPGYDSWEALIDLEFRVLELKPDLVVLHHGLNDVHSRLVNPENYRPDNTGRRKQWEHQPCLSPRCLRVVEFVEQRLGRLFDVDAPDWGAPDPKRLRLPPERVLAENRPIYFERNMQSMLSLLAQHRVAAVISSCALSPAFPDYASAAYSQQALAEHNEILKRLADSNSVPFYDYAAAMPTQREWWADGRHVNESGARKKAELIAGFLLSKALVALDCPTTR